MEPLSVRIGLLSDVQYADVPDGLDFSRTRRRFYRGALAHLEAAVAAWSAPGHPHLVLSLGDVLDGHCRRQGHSREALERLERLFSSLPVPAHHLVGNHELYNLPRAALLRQDLFAAACELLPPSAAARGLLYYRLRPCAGYRLLLLDAFDVSVLGRAAGTAERDEATALLRQHNTNSDWNDPIGLARPQFTEYNGGLGPDQLAWLCEEMEAARAAGESVIVASHVPLHPCCSTPQLVLWNWEEVSAAVRRFAGTVRLVLCGHTHEAKTGRDEAGVPHVALPGLVETPADRLGVGVLELSATEIRLDGHGGLVPDLRIPLQ